MWISRERFQTIYDMFKSNSDEIENIKKSIEHRKFIRIFRNEEEINLEEAMQELGMKCCFLAIDLEERCDEKNDKVVSDIEKIELMLKTLDSVSFALSLLKQENSHIEPPQIKL